MNEENEVYEEEGSGGKKWLAVVLVLVVLLGAASGVFLYYRSSAAAGEEGSPRATAKVKSMTVPSFTVNLADSTYRRYLRTSITLEYYPNKKLERELKDNEYRLRDAIIGVLRTKTVNDINTQEKTAALRLELVEAANEVLQHGDISGIYFREFIIQ